MRIARVIGTVTTSRLHSAFEGARFRLAVPLSLEDLLSGKPTPTEPVVMYDELGAGEGSLVAMSESREASQPLLPKQCPIDAYCAAILDEIHVEPLEGEG